MACACMWKFKRQSNSNGKKKNCRQYKATTACTVRLLYKMGLSETDLPKTKCVFADSWFTSVDTALALNIFKSYLATHGTTLPGKPADKRRQGKDTNVNFALQVPRPACIAKYNEQMGAVDRHNFYRQGVLRLHMAWRTKTWQTRIQMEILAPALVDSFLACTKLLPQWVQVHHPKDEESVFWKFVCSLVEQLDTRPRHERTREEEVDPTQQHSNPSWDEKSFERYQQRRTSCSSTSLYGMPCSQ